MRQCFRTICCLLLLPVCAQAQTESDRLLRGEILFSSLTGKPLDAVFRYTTDRGFDTTSSKPGAISITDAQLALGLGEAVKKKAKIRSEDKNAQSFINRDAFGLARFYYDNHEPTLALQVLDGIKGKTADVSATDLDYLRALIYMDIGRFREAAQLLYELPLYQRPNGYTQYNLALAQLQGGNEERGRNTLESLGEINTSDTDLLALKDLANIKLGYRFLQQGSLKQAKSSFNRVRLDGPFTNQALLGSGWTSFYMGQVERAVVAWSRLHEQDAIDDVVIEAKMALPYAYSKLGAHGKAANLYAHAIELLEAEIARLDAASAAVRKGELSRTIIANHEARGDDWFIGLSRDREAPPLYLPLLLANQEFREQADELHQLVQLNKRVKLATNSAAVSAEFVRLKKKSYDRTLPSAEKELSAISQEIKSMLPPPTPPTDPAARPAEPVAEIALLKQRYDTYLATRKAMADYGKRLPEVGRELAALEKKLKSVNKKLGQAITRAGKQVEAVALAALDQKRNQLKGYHHKALFALAESYDFATGKRQ